MSGKYNIGVVADWLVTYAGAERVIKEFIDLYPNADLYSVVDFLSDESVSFFMRKSENYIYSKSSICEKKISKIFTTDAIGN